MNKTIVILPGDGIGPEIMDQAIGVLQAIEQKFGHSFTLEEGRIGAHGIQVDGSPLPDKTLQICLSSDAVLLAAIGEPAYDNNPDLSMRPEQGLLALRKAMNLYTNIRPVQTNKKLKHLSQLKCVEQSNIDMVIYRELSSGIYYGKRTENPTSDIATDECYYNRAEIERISIPAFEAAQSRSKKLCLVDKPNVLATSRLWRRVVQELSSNYPDVELSYLFVDNAAMQMVLDPTQFDVILCSNMFGDIISDLASTIPGSIGLLPSASLGPDHAMFEPVHGSYPQAAGKNIANPIAMIRSVAMLMNYFGLNQEADCIEAAIDTCISQGAGTPDLMPQTQLTTSALGELISTKILEQPNAVLYKDAIISEASATINA